MRLFGKLHWVLRTASLGDTVSDKLTLLLAQLHIALFKNRHVPYSVTISVEGRKATIHLLGSYDEIGLLREIFIGKCYAPSSPNVRTVLDLGANIGLAAVWFSLMYPDAVIHSYEPATHVHSLLQKNLPKNAKFFPYAIAAKAGTVLMNVSERSVESSIAFRFPHMETVEMQAVTLDDAIRTIGGSVDVIKMDIEGAEFDVLAGSSQLALVGEIVGEVHPAFAKRDIGELRQALTATHTLTVPESKSKSYTFYAVRVSGSS